MLPNNRKSFSARRLVLMASVAAVGAALLVGVPGSYHAGLPAWTGAASAADSTMQHPSGFADIVAKVKPAVISVRVKMDAAAEPALMQQQRNDDDDQDAVPPVPGSPMEKFFQQFGRQGRGQMQVPQGHRTIAAEGSGFFITADGYAVTNNHVVDKATTVEVSTDDGKVHSAKVIRSEERRVGKEC